MTITAIRIERDDDLAGEFYTDEDFTRLVQIYDATERAHVAVEFGIHLDAVEVIVHRNTSGFRPQLSWTDDIGCCPEQGPVAERIREAMCQALEAAWERYEATMPAPPDPRALPDGWEIDSDDGDTFTAYPSDLQEDRHGDGIGFGICVQLDPDEHTAEPIRACVIDAADGEPGIETYTGISAVGDAIDAARREIR